jgi:polysaccharide pyruvyl transferase WcaK-like protein
MKVLVYGWYNQSNIGDDLFVEAFQQLFPNCQFVFCDAITTKKLENIDAVFFGGGSFLYSPPNIPAEVLQLLKSKKIFYIGVGVEIDIHPTHLDLMRAAKLIATRSPDQVDRLKEINPNTRWIPDLVYSLQSKVVKLSKFNKSVLIMPNIAVVPKNSEPHWKHAAWTYFKSEFSQFLDYLVTEGYRINFLSMCQGNKDNDDWAIAELLSSMDKGDKTFILNGLPVGIRSVTALVSKYETVITQRFHGIILSEMTRTPYLAIHHHDKLRFVQPNDGVFINYYNSSKRKLIDSFEQSMKMKFQNSFPTESTIFEALSKDVLSLT